MPPEVSHLLYADDLQVYIQVPPEEMSTSIDTMSHIAKKVSCWANSVSLRLNQDKTKAIFFGTSKLVDRINKQNYPGIDLGGGIIIPFVKEVKSLGMTLDSKLSWEPHVITVEKKVNRVLYTLRFIRDCTTEALRIKLVQSLVLPHLDYCSTVYLDASTKLKARIQRLSNSGIRYIFGVRKDSSITPFRRKLCWLLSDSRRLYFTAIIMYKILRLNQPDYLTHLFIKQAPKSNARGERRFRELSLPKPQDCGISSFQLRGTKFWNSLPHNLLHISSLDCFKSCLSQYLLSLDP